MGQVRRICWKVGNLKTISLNLSCKSNAHLERFPRRVSTILVKDLLTRNTNNLRSSNFLPVSMKMYLYHFYFNISDKFFPKKSVSRLLDCKRFLHKSSFYSPAEVLRLDKLKDFPWSEIIFSFKLSNFNETFKF
jgi:hypothetical protein